MEYDALLLLSFGGPEGPDDVLPFLRNVVRGRGRAATSGCAEVAEHYRHFGGVSPINEQSRALLRGDPGRRARIAAGLLGQPQLAPAGRGHGRDHARRRGAARARVRHQRLRRRTRPAGSTWTTSRGPGRRSGDGRAGAGQAAALLRPSRVRRAARRRGPGRAGGAARRGRDAPGWCSPRTRSRPSMEASSGPDGGPATPRSCARRPGWSPRRSAGPAPSGTWSGSPGPGRRGAVAGAGRQRPPGGARRRAVTSAVVVSPIGFVSDHLEVLWDLDDGGGRDRGQARAATSPGRRPPAPTRGSSGWSASWSRSARPGRRSWPSGPMGPSHDVCPLDCCPAPRRRP